jgi:triacylglycerol esterase/lipase EstA (alpha/beta hydrolase family)
MKIEVSIGEVVDKYTILTIKKLFIHDSEKLVNIEKEWKIIKSALVKKYPETLTDPFTQELYDINKKLWKVEDDIRDCEYKNDFKEKFIELAREVYQLNDVRAIIKKQINQKYGSELIEEKSYKQH